MAGTVGTQIYGISGNDIVGEYVDASNNHNGFLYNGSTYFTLDDPLAANVTYATGISGNIVVGWYQDASSVYHGFEASLAPVPEPSSFILFGLGAIGLAVVSRRRMRKGRAVLGS